MSASLAAGTNVGRYQVRSFLGAGGMGEVYLAWEPTLDREVALKILRPELTTDSRRVGRFVTEARAASSLSHPSVVTIFEVGEERANDSLSSLHYIAMERVEGVTLAEWLLERPPLDAVLEQLAQVSDAVAEAHSKGIVHRDLKPENIMVSRNGVAKVLDFGIAKLVDLDLTLVKNEGAAGPTLTEARTLIGTPRYRSPEQIEGLPVDHRADIFSLGCVVYESVSGRAAFAGDTNAATIHNIVCLDPPELTFSNRDATRVLNRIIARCLAKEREARYDSARDLSHDLRQAAHVLRSLRREVRALRAPRRSRAGRFLRLFAGALALIVLVSLLAGLWDVRAQLAEQRTQAVALSSTVSRQEQELASRGEMIERLRLERDESERVREDLETSYRSLLSDVSAHLTKSSTESSQLQARVDAAEKDLSRFREELLRRNAEQELMQRVERQLSTSMATRVDARGVIAVIPGALFRTGHSELSPPGNVMVDQVARELTANPGLQLMIEGHTDSNGDSDENRALSQQRADHVKYALIGYGIESSRITAIGRGETEPAFDNESIQGRLHNRRIELLFTTLPD